MDASSAASTSTRVATDFIRTHQVRLGAGLLLGLVLVLAVLTGQPFLVFLLLGPILMGCLPPLLGLAQVSEWINGCDQKLERLQTRAQGGSGKFSRYFLRPLSASSLWLWSQTASVQNPDRRAGLRLAAVTYLWGGMVIALGAVIYVMIVVVMVILFLLLMLWIVSLVLGGSGSSGGGGRKWKERLSGTRVVEEGTFFDSDTGMKINAEGRLVKQGVFFDDPAGIKIDEEGRIIREGVLFDTPSGIKIDNDGRVVKEGVFDSATGMKIDDQGRIVEEGVFFDNPTGKKFKKE